ncbi:hypothetical protein RJT34_14567 [Clitoria ternatea]|uniref:Uncharacterized protein n=1 Tax=Clitoria ternatea TaxID=43366 RepID=A0AAN9JQM7_CLITE
MFKVHFHKNWNYETKWTSSGTSVSPKVAFWQVLDNPLAVDVTGAKGPSCQSHPLAVDVIGLHKTSWQNHPQAVVAIH